MTTLFQDIRYGCRSLWAHRGFAIVAVLVLGLGIGANATIFSIVNAFLFRPVPVKDPQQLAVLLATGHQLPFPHPISYPDYLDYRNQHTVFRELAALFPAPVNWNSGGQSEHAWVMVATGNYFSMLGVEPALGRTFTADEDRVPGADPVAVIGYGCWQRRFGGGPDVVGKTIRLNGHPFTIIGVAPEKMTKIATASWEAYVPSMMGKVIWPEWEMLANNRAQPAVFAIGRLRPDVTIAQANAAIGARSRQLAEAYPQSNRDVMVSAVPESQARPEPALAKYLPPISAFVLALVALVLAVACANVANLMLARTMARQKELAIRAALGASRWRLLRQLITESMLLALLGAVAGLLLSMWVADFFAQVKPGGDVPVVFDFRPDWRVFAYTFAIAIFAGLAMGLAPAIQASEPDLNTSIKEGARSWIGQPGRHRLRGALVVAQVAVSLLLLVCAGLFIRSTQEARKIDPGFRSRDLLLMQIDQRRDEAGGRRFYQQLLDRVQSLPGVRAASLASRVPFGAGQGGGRNIFLDEKPEMEPLLAVSFIVGGDYFRTMEIPILSGRSFTARDDWAPPRVAVINQALADRLWPGQESVGRRFRFSQTDSSLEVIGVAHNHKYMLLGEAPRPGIYLPLGQNYEPAMTLQLHTSVDPSSLTAAARQAVAGLDESAAVFNVRTMEANLNSSVAYGSLVMGVAVVGAFGAIGLLLASLGLYGLISFNVARRTHEIGVRIALGARSRDVLRLVVGQGMQLVLLGIGIGLVLALAATRLLKSLLFGVSTIDPLTVVSVVLLLIGVALLACYLPARRATKVDPMAALRCE